MFKFKKSLWVQNGDYVNAMKALNAKKIPFKGNNTGLHFDPLTAIIVFVLYTALIILL
jgi:hypothetical protein